MDERAIAWGPAAVWAVVLFFLGSIPGVSAGELPVNDKVIHLGLYALLGGALAWGRLRSPSPPTHLLLVSLGVVAGLVDEFHQAYVPGRDASGGDLLADTVGVLAGYTLLILFSRPGGLRAFGRDSRDHLEPHPHE